MIEINGYEVEGPLVERPQMDDLYWYWDGDGAVECEWRADSYDFLRYELGIFNDPEQCVRYHLAIYNKNPDLQVDHIKRNEFIEAVNDMFDHEIIIDDLGETVLCDYCGDDYTNRDDKGGILFGSKATCPACTAKMMPDIMKYGEQRYIKSKCPEGKRFNDWVREDLR